MLTPAVLFPKMFGKDPYDMDPGWRPIGFVIALEGTKGGPVREFGTAPNHDDYLKLEGEFEKRTMDVHPEERGGEKAVLCRLLAGTRLPSWLRRSS